MLIDICRERGLFELLRDGAFHDREALAAQLKANAGPFAVALDALAEAGVVERRGEAYRTTGAAPMFAIDGSLTDAQLRELLFGDAGAVMRDVVPSRRDAEVDALLRQKLATLVAGDGAPQVIVDVEGGDGSALAELLPPDLSARLVVADGDRQNLDAAAATLHARGAQTLLCGIDQPETLRSALGWLGLRTDETVLELRRFTESALPAGAPQTADAGLLALASEMPAQYLDDSGAAVDALTVLGARLDHLRRLAAARVRLLVAERHDARWQGRLLRRWELPAEAFVVLAARAGLFASARVRRVPESGPRCTASVQVLEAREYIVRHAVEADLDRLCELETLCWQHTRTPREQILARLQRYPLGQFVLEKEGRVLGAIYSQRIAGPDALFARTAADVHELHDPAGSVIQLLAVNIDPHAQNANYGDQLLEFMLQRCSVMTGIDRVVGVTLCKSYDAAQCGPFEEYIRREGSAQDPVLAFHHAHGAEIVRAVPHYRPEDAANQHNGVLVSYDIQHRPQRRQAPAAQTGALDREEVRAFLIAEAARLLGIAASEVDADRPVMEMGLDSADLLKLQRLCEERFGVALQAGFFFEHSSVRKVVDALCGERVSAPRNEAAPVAHERASDIAVIGMACRLPGGIDSPEALWRVLAAGDCVIGPYPAARGAWPASGDYPGIDQGGFVRDAEAFDAAFFRISPAEAQVTDPQQRMMLELAWASLEDAGVLPADLRGSKTGVFVGASNCDYSRLVQEAGLEIEAHNGVGSSLAILANRVSYFFDLNGPSLVIDTACSSSLVALHTAVQSLRSGECSIAFAGGVNLICHPDLSIAYRKAGMLAPDARCKVFDRDANGYVRSEGAVVFLLKPLRAALADGDRIHAVIRGTAINHGGLAGGLTVPNPQKQKDLLLSAWADAAVSARELTYLEAHGTGTSLGDPIEVQGIQAAFEAHGPSAANPCAIGSVKSNLGHLESAAGITGLLKVILSLRHGQIPASVHFRELNPMIRLDGSPLRVQQHLGDWSAQSPRIAGVSSFGSGGANAHVVVQEFAADRTQPRDEGDFLFVLSAATDERLRASAERVREWLAGDGAAVPFADAIFTWQRGRTAMKRRLAIRVRNRAELVAKLQQWLAGAGDVAALWSSDAAQHDIDRALAPRDHDRLGPLWVSGIDVAWPAAGDERIASVPTYSFARERYWIDVTPSAPIHPLLHAPSGGGYRATWDGGEFFLAGHQVRIDGRLQRVLPGVAYLEMVRAAVEQSGGGGALELRDTVWLQPLAVDGETEVQLDLRDGQYEIFSERDGARVVHCEGSAVALHEAPQPVDLDAIERQLGSPVEPRRLYESFAAAGLVYGEAFRAIASLREGRDGLVARLRLPQSVADEASAYALHPSLMDGAMQAAVWLAEGGAREGRLRLPFALESLRVFAPCAAEMAAWVRPSGTSKIDVDLCDAQGKVCVQMHGLSLRAPVPRHSETLLARAVWQNADATTASAEFAERLVLVCERPESDEELRARGDEPIAQRYGRYAAACLTRVRELLAARARGNVLVQVVVPDEGERVLLAGLSGLLKAAAQEMPRLSAQLILVPAAMTAEELARVLRDEAGRDAVVRYAGGVRQVQRWEEVAADADAPVAYREHGVYLITGGLGALGRILARDVLAKTASARVVLTGRGELDPRKQRLVDELGAEVGRVVYRRLDVTNAEEVLDFVDGLLDEFGRLDGVLHAAGMIADSFLVKKTAAELDAVLAPKVSGAVNLDAATRSVALDFFVLFSSFAGALGNVGQADYAAANAFLDAFAAHRNRLVAAGERRGRTRSIGWPLWSEGGMTMDAASRERLARDAGMQPMETAAGLRAFHRALALPHDHLLVLEGDAARIRRMLAGAAEEAEAPAAAVAIEAGTLAQKTEEYLRRQLARVLKMQAGAIDAQAPLEEYGIDSMLAMKMIGRLEETFGRLPKTLFFEYQTIRALAGHFVESYAPQLSPLFATTAAKPAQAPIQTAARVEPAPVPSRMRRSIAAEPIAIIGLSGRYPGAIDVEAYWKNLRDGKDCITEVPRERWDWREFYSDDRTRGGRHFSKWGGFIEGVDEFDPQFFNIAPKEARYIDPQERLFLQHAWMAIEDAGLTRAALQIAEGNDLPGQVGVYAGVMWSEYQLFGTEADAEELRMGFAGNPASIANRVSYVLNLHGPSMTVDTMCSSSLTAIHVACQDLRLGRTSLALAGGVNVSVHPHKYLLLSTGQFISGDGHCQSFGEGGDGYIPGEGVGVVVLKRLSDAERDGDRIYGVIRGSALTHGGKVNGYTVPNPQAQASAISRALAEAEVDARAISYVEAHGTGTKLGDPIEIAALSKAFEPYAKEATGYCLIGSAKSNVGHCEAAAGVAGLTKVLLQMQHGEIVPSLHSERLNPHIDFERTPFVVNQTLRRWEPPVVDGRALPRIAGISSFGAGGSNAHMIVEEYVAPPRVAVTVADVAVPLSARTPEQLLQKARDLAAFIRSRAVDLPSLAYTLQVGREPMDERLIVVASSTGDLLAKLDAFIDGEESIDDVHRGQARRNREALAIFTSDPDLQQTLTRWLESGKLAKVAELWARGLEIDWTKLYGEARPRRISLPVYPFAREHYWIEAAPQKAAPAIAAAMLHPLLHVNASDLTEQRYRSTFTHGDVVDEAAQLEMLRAAVAHAAPAREEASQIELRDVVWGEPLSIGEKTEVTVTLWPGQGESIELEIASDAGVHCQARASFVTESAPLAEMQQRATLPAPAGGDDYVVPPALLGAALQLAGATALERIDLVRIAAPCRGAMTVFSRTTNDGIDVELRDEHGQVCVQLRGARVQRAEVATEIAEAEPQQESNLEPVVPALERREIEFLPTTTAAFAPSKPSKKPVVALRAPAVITAKPVIGRPKITLAKPGIAAPAKPSAVRLYDRGRGIFTIEIAASRSADAIAHLLLALDRLREEASLRVVTLAGIEHCFVRGGRGEWNEAVERGLFRALAEFPYPLIAVQPGDVAGAGLLAAALCDFLILGENAVYGFTDAARQFHPTAPEVALLAARFGEGQGQEIVFGITPRSGSQLRASGWSCPIVPWNEVESHAELLAIDLAAKSQDALRLLEQHLSRDLVPLVSALTAVGGAAITDATQLRAVRFDANAVARLRELAADPACGAIVLAMEGDAPLLGSDDVLALGRAIAAAPVPVIAALEGDAVGRACLVAQFCDTAVYARDAAYAAADIAHDPHLAHAAATLFPRRLGRAAHELLLTGAAWSGAELQQRAPHAHVTDREEVRALAMQIAGEWARTPRATWSAWKSHTAASLAEQASTARTEETESVVQAGPIALRSSAVHATAEADGVVVVRMEDREAKNMFSPALMNGLREAFAHIAASRAYRVVVLTGFGPYFASGGTKESLLAIQEGRARFTDYDVYRLAVDCELPVIAAMQGHGIGAGWSMGMFADLALLSEESRYVSPYMSYGFTPGAGATHSLVVTMGRDLARESLFTARETTGRELAARGAGFRILPRAEVLAGALALARQIARVPRRLLVELKARLHAAAHAPLAETFRRELAMHEETFVGRADTLARIEEKFARESEAQAPAPPVVELPAPVAASAVDGDPLRGVIASLRAMLAHELQLRESDLDEHAQFVDLGLDSISGVTWIRKINAKYGTAIEATKVYALPTLVQLGRHVKEEAEARGTLGSAPPPAVVVEPVRIEAPKPGVKRERSLASRRGAAARFAGGTAARRPEPIAVIGMAGQFPRARNLDEYWQNIAAGRNCIEPVPHERWNAEALYQPGDPAPGKTTSRWAGMIEGYDRFDPLFFNISPTEAEHMDPQQRVFLEACWHAIENAGYAARALSGTRCGVFAGCGAGDYQQLSRRHQLSAQGFTGNATSILAARISYFLNLQGPCVSIDTACSSSLVAVAAACDSLTAGSSDLALAGGVYVMTGPEMHIKTAQAGMLSPDGRCFTFDERANGFVPGEGTGVVLLKRLSDALRDDDPIHAVIHGWGVNQDGKTNGITAPNPESQTRLEQEVYDRFGIDPSAIELIEAHGTGTKLGDPIEVTGLKNAFRKYTQNAEYCALGSVKSNIGHCLNAAGVAGLLKLVLALKHRQIPPTIHFERLNEHIELKGSPFYVSDRLREWRPSSDRGRLAATSSFGFSGTNAHLVVGESVPREERRPVALRDGRAIVPLSARTAEQLTDKARELLNFLRTHSAVDLAELSYTLQVGREPMDERLGVVAGSIAQLAERLEGWLGGAARIDGVHRGRVTRTAESTSLLNQDEDVRETIVAKWIAEGKLGRLAELWTHGLDVSWDRLYGERKPRRIALPLYPFARERYWIDAEERAVTAAAAQQLHPLVHRNTSDFASQRYSSTFAGDEFFLRDHRVRIGDGDAARLLPGVAYLEMARAAIAQAAWEEGVIELRDTTWLEPVIAGDGAEVSIALVASEDGGIEFEIVSGATVHCRGQAVLTEGAEGRRLDVRALRQRANGRTLGAGEVYAICNAMGLHYGPAHQGITRLQTGDGQLLADLQLPPVVAATRDQFVLHPSLLDSALQASIGLIVDPQNIPTAPYVPFAVESVRILGRCTAEMVASVRHASGRGAGQRMAKVDIDLCDASGNVQVEIRGFALRMLERGARPAIAAPAPQRLPIKSNGDGNGNGHADPFDEAFYEQLIQDIADHKLTVDEAADLS